MSSPTKMIKSNLGLPVKHIPTPRPHGLLCQGPPSPFLLDNSKTRHYSQPQGGESFLDGRAKPPQFISSDSIGSRSGPQYRPADCCRFAMPQSLAFAEISLAPHRSGFAPSK